MSATQNNTREVENALRALATEARRSANMRYFKTNPGEYGAGDIFIGISVPDIRTVVRESWDKLLPEDTAYFLTHTLHEFRLFALLVLVKQFEKSKTLAEKEKIVTFYKKHLDSVNNWDLVDASAHKILGKYALLTEDDTFLEQLSLNKNPWYQRIAVVGTMYHVKENKFCLTKKLVLNNLQTANDLMQKANGWLLREIGIKNEETLYAFLKEHYAHIPRTTLRYAIEKFSPFTRKEILKGIFS